MKDLYFGDVVFTPTPDGAVCYKDAYILVEDGTILEVLPSLPSECESFRRHEHPGKLILPSFTDLHLHAVQYANRGIGMDMELLPWLQNYTYPEELKFSDLEYAETVFKRFVIDLWEFGSLRSCIYSSLHEEATLLLFELMDKAGLSSNIGKVMMDRNTFHGLEETADKAMESMRRVLERTSVYKKLHPILTPRFIPTCSDALLSRMGEMAEKEDLPVQSHLNENPAEVVWVSELVPEADNYLDAYRIRGLIRPGKTIMAHAIYNTDEEIEAFVEEDILLAHCPSSNLNLSSGIMRAKELLEAGVRIGLGSDISGGNSMRMTDVMVDAVKSSNILSVMEKKDHFLSISEVYYMATKGSGGFFGKTGSFEPGYSFDALIVEDSVESKDRTIKERLERFIYGLEERSITHRYLEGIELLRPDL